VKEIVRTVNTKIPVLRDVTSCIMAEGNPNHKASRPRQESYFTIIYYYYYLNLIMFNISTVTVLVTDSRGSWN
jgi:hypothetical protein